MPATTVCSSRRASVRLGMGWVPTGPVTEDEPAAVTRSAAPRVRLARRSGPPQDAVRAHPAMCPSLHYQLYFAQFEEGCSINQEIELNVISLPTSQASRVPALFAVHPGHRPLRADRLLRLRRRHTAYATQWKIDCGECDGDLSRDDAVHLRLSLNSRAWSAALSASPRPPSTAAAPPQATPAPPGRLPRL